ncbi:TPA_asm: N [Pinus flexilis virus 1]|uniref:Nucleoprotein n=1 Tax=Pinus flexilis virus 1 TaxID=2793737 RepID=A0A8D9PH93_9RHAB|nr:N [Pinus flexilis virus 1] [Pinus flexilis virus 1]DAF42369.1 TPA_asm: N [Pinus flexilis virus 1]
MAGIPEIKVDTEFEDIKTSFTASGTSKTDWNDDMLVNKPGYKLTKLLDSETSDLIKEVFPKLETGVSEKDVLKLMNIAWNARAPGKIDKRMFPEKPYAIGAMANEIETADDEIISTTGYRSSIKWAGKSSLLICQGGGYYALAMLRMFVKSDENMRSAKGPIREKFYSHYEKSFPMEPFEIHDTVIRTIHTLFQNRDSFKWTLAPFLYHMKDEKDGKIQGIIEATYGIHLKDAGMKCWSLFKEVAQKLNSDSAMLLTVLKIEATVKALRCIATMIRNFEGDSQTLTSTKRDKKTYQYARIFDNEMFLDLQTKNCIPLTLTLACLSKKVNPKGTGDVTNMMAIRGADAEVKSLYEKFSQEIYNYYHKSKGCAKGNVLFEMAVGIEPAKKEETKAEQTIQAQTAPPP